MIEVPKMQRRRGRMKVETTVGCGGRLAAIVPKGRREATLFPTQVERWWWAWWWWWWWVQACSGQNICTCVVRWRAILHA
eukprot:scaffold37735_cov80-Skeletonema_marinoi.AAC.2